MRSLQRVEFVNRNWDGTKLNAVGEFWVRHAEAGKRVARVYLELRLSGFPNSAAESIRNRLEERISAANLACDARIDGDTVEAVIAIPGRDQVPDGLGLLWLIGPQFEGLVAEVRLRVGASRWNAFGIAIIGELRSDALHVKALWITRRPGDDDSFWMQPFPEEEKLLAAIERFWRSDKIDPEIASWFLQSPLAGMLGRWYSASTTKLCITPIGSPRAAGILLRVAVLGLVLVAIGWFALRQPDGLPHFLLRIVSFFSIGFWLVLILHFVRYELSLLLTYSTWQHVYREWERRQEYRILDRSESEQLALDPAIRKHTADLTAAGFRHFGDVTETLRECPIRYRMFLDPDGNSYFVLGVNTAHLGANGERMNYWPALIVFQSQTFFAGGGRVDSVSTDYYRKCAIGPNTLVRSRIDPNPLTFHESHKAAVEAFAASVGLSVARHVGLERYVEWQREIHEADREYLRAHPYGPLDHLRWYLQWPQGERRGS